MQMLSRNPAAIYRRIELDARIEASGGADLTRIWGAEHHGVARSIGRQGASAGGEP